MSTDYNSSAFKKLLQKLQEESWQLELLISGFAIFGLFSVYEPLRLSIVQAEIDEQFYKLTISYVAISACVILIFNLLLHVLLRGLWIGALGLRYVSGDIDYDYLKYSPKFTNHLKKRVGSFDKYIATLENYCSIIFAISFLLIFYVLALTFTILSIVIVVEYIIENETLPNWLSQPLGISLIIYISIGILLTFIDFATQGWLKKKQWISKLYFPFYWGFSFITLSFLYRPIVYNFLDNKFGKRISLILLPIFILLILSTSYTYNFSNFFSANLNASSYITSDNNYMDYAEKENVIIDDIAIQSKVVSNNYLNIYIKYTQSIEDNILEFNKNINPEIDRRGLQSGISIGWNAAKIQAAKRAGQKIVSKDSLRREYLKTFNQLYTFKIDSISFKSDFIVNKNRLGFETFIDITKLNKGRHVLNVNRTRMRKKDTVTQNYGQIVFWYYPD